MKVVTTAPVGSKRGTIPAGIVIDITEATLGRLAGKIQMVPEDHTRLLNEVRAMVRQFGHATQDARILPWARGHRPALWDTHSQAMQAITAAFREQNVDRVQRELETAKTTFREIITAWEQRDHYQQQSLI